MSTKPTEGHPIVPRAGFMTGILYVLACSQCHSRDLDLGETEMVRVPRDHSTPVRIPIPQNHCRSCGSSSTSLQRFETTKEG